VANLAARLPTLELSVVPGPACDKPNSCDQTQSGVGKSCVKKIKYDDEHRKFGFMSKYTSDQDDPKPRCVICGDVLANSSLKPSLLWRHLESRHATQINKAVDFFKRKMMGSKECCH
jgi:hypothetical protein